MNIEIIMDLMDLVDAICIAAYVRAWINRRYRNVQDELMQQD